MNYQIKNKLISKRTFDNIGTFYFYDHFMISEINEGVTVSLEMMQNITNTYTKKYYSPDIPFVYIANRVNSYSIQPTVHFETKKLLPNSIGYAVVAYNSINDKIASLEEEFLDNIPTRVFDNVEDAVSWAQELVTPHKTVQNDR